MISRYCLAFALALGGLGYAAQADTITLPDGSKMDGVVHELNANCVELTVGDSSIQFQRSEIASIERNTKQGDASKHLVLPSVQQWENEIDAKTGLNSDQREKVLALLYAWRSAQDPADRKRAEGDILALNKTIDIVKFIKASFESATIARRMTLIEALGLLDPADALPMLEQGMLINQPGYRAFCVSLYEGVKKKAGRVDKKTLTYLARAAIDPDEDVQIAAAQALADCKSKAATPVLMAQLRAPDQRLCNASNLALAKIWEVDVDSIPQDRSAYWQQRWSSDSALIDSTFDPEKLKPLVDKDAPVVDTLH